MVKVSTRDIRTKMKELENALREVKEAMSGKRVLQSAESLLDEL